MKSRIINIDGNNSVISYENGDTLIASKENDLYKFDDIIAKEAEIDDISSKIKHNKSNLKGYIAAIKYDKIFKIILAIVELLILISLYSKVSVPLLLFMMGMSYVVGKVLWIGIVGTRKSMKRNINKLTEDIEKLETIKPMLENELKKIKEKVNYKTRKPDISKMDNINYNFDINLDYNDGISKEEQNVLKITK